MTTLQIFVTGLFSLFLSFATPALAAVIVGNSTGSFVQNSPTLIFSHTVDNGSDRVLVVGLAWESLNDTLLTVQSVTYGGNPLTQITSANTFIASTGPTAQNNSTQLWYLLNPTIGTANVDITLSGTPPSSRAIWGNALNLTNAQQQAPQATSSTTVTDTSIADSGISVTSGAAVVSFVNHGGTNVNLTPNSGQIEIFSGVAAGTGSSSAMGVLVAPLAGINFTSWDTSPAELSRIGLSVASFAAVPEPSTGLIFGLGAAVVGVTIYRRRMARA